MPQAAVTGTAARTPTPVAPLPAGTYFRGYDTCGGCTTPTHVVLAAIVQTPQAAHDVIAALPTKSLSPGYPLVVHTDEIGLVDPQRGIAIVVGLFGDAEAADAWAAELGVRTTVLPLLAADQWSPRASGNTRVVRVAVPTANAYERRAVERIEAELQDRQWNTLEEADRALRERVLALVPACTLALGSLQLWTSNDDHRIPWYQWAPVHCADREAYVAWRDTWLDSSIVQASPGVHEVVQVTGAECDSPILRGWSWTAQGKSTAEPTKLRIARGGC